MPESIIGLLSKITQKSAVGLVERIANQRRIASDEKAALKHAQKQRRVNWWRKIIGSSYEEIITNPGAIKTYCADPDPKIRLGALSLGEDEINVTPDFIEACELMITRDLDRRVRETAITVLARINFGNDNGRLGMLLASLVRDDSQELSLRRTAYGALFQLRGIPVQYWPIMQKRPNRFRFPEDVDWLFVDSFGYKGKKGSG